MRSQLLSEISRSGRRRWLQVDEMPFSSAPNHYMAVSVKGASRGSGATVTLDGPELRRNGRNPVATRLTNNGAEILPPVTCPKPPLKGGRRGASGGTKLSATSDITNPLLARGLSSAEAKRCLVRVGMMLLL
jgi:hypothetical protein